MRCRASTSLGGLGSAFLFAWAALSFAGCAELNSGSSAKNAPPSDIVYATNPANYTINTAITANTPTTARSVSKFSISPALPAGLSLDPSTGIISGTPTAITAATTYAIHATNAYGSAFVNLELAVNDHLPTITYGGTTTLSYTVGTAISTVTPTLGGGATVACQSIPSLPAGLSLSSQCVLSGTPTVAAPTPTDYKITAINSGGQAALDLNITVIDIPPAFTYSSGTFSLVRGTAVTTGAAISTGGVITSCASAPNLPAGLSLDSSCNITGTPTAVAASTGYTITGTNSGGNHSIGITLDVHDVAPAISYSGGPYNYTINKAITALAATNTGGVINTCTSSPALPAGLSLAGTTCSITGTPTALAASTSYTITATNSAGSSNATVTIAVNDVAPTLSYTGAPFTFTHNTAITTQTPVNTGGTIVACSSSPALPAGLALSNSSCAISGTPTVASAQTSYTITATNSGGTAQQTIKITVNQIAPNLTYTGNPFSWDKNVTITTQTPNNTGDAPTNCTSSPALPAGISLSPTCVISGTPTAIQASTSYTITATNAVGSDPVTISITVNDTPPAISYPGTPYTFTKGVALTTINPISTGGAVTSCSSSPTLPTGLTLSSTCAISGTPTAITASANYTITATNAGGSGNAVITITVNDVAPNISYTGSPFTYVKGTAITTLTPTNTGGTVISCSSNPALPTGLSLSATCVLSGTPTVVAAAASYTITGTNTGGASSATIQITVNDVAPNIAYGGSPFTFTKGTAITAQTPANTGGLPTACSSSPGLPAGLSLSTACVLTGTPTTGQTAATYNITATNTGGSSSTSISITVNTATPVISYTDAPYTFAKTVATSAAIPTNTGGGINSCSSSPALPAGLSLGATTCQVQGTPTAITATASYTITATNANGTGTATITITVNDAPPSISYPTAPFTWTVGNAVSQSATSSGGTVTSCSVNPALPAGLSLSSTCTISGTPTAVTAIATYTITATNVSGNSAVNISITINDKAPAGLSYAGSPFTLTVGAALSAQTPANTGGTITGCSSSPSLPAGLTLSSACVLSGTPTTITAAATYTITATNTGGSGTASVTITVNDVAPSALAYAGSPFSINVNSAMTPATPTSSGGAITGCSSSPSLPAGLSLSTACVLSGTPTTPSGATSYTITASNTGGSTTKTISITVNNVAPVISYSGSPFTFVKGTAISSQTPTNTGGAITSCSSSPALPSGLSLSTACVLSGTPTVVVAATSYTITATNAMGSGNATITITINDTAPALTYSPSTEVEVVRTAISTITPVSTGGAITGCSSSPAMPAGLTLSSACVITGTPTTIQASTAYTVTATNTGGSANATINIQVKNQPTVVFYGLTQLSAGTWNGTAPGSNNLWTATWDGVTITQLTSNSGNSQDSIQPSYIATGGNVTFNSKMKIGGSNARSYNIWTATNTGGSQTYLTGNTGNSYAADDPPVYSPDGSQIAFASKADTSGLNNGTGSGSYNIFVVSSSGGTPTALTFNTNSGLDSRAPVWSPDGTMIYFYSKTNQNGNWNATANNNYNIWRINATGTGMIALTTDNTLGRDSMTPQISPDGNTVCYVSKERIGTTTANSYNIWTMNLDGTAKTYLTSNTSASLDSTSCHWSPSGADIVFQSLMKIGGATSSSYNIWTMTSSGLSQVALTQNTAASLDSQMPSYSPDGTRIAFYSLQNVGATASSSNNIWIMNANGTSQTAVTQNTNAGLDSYLGPSNVWYAP